MEQASNSHPTKKIMYITLGLAVTGLLGYFGWNYYEKKKNSNNAEADFTTDNKDTTTANDNIPAQASASTNVHNNFPIRKGSRGEYVRILQQALINRYGAGILSKYGADGDFGDEMETALQKVHLPTSIDESTYNLLVKGTSPDSDALAKSLVSAAITRNFNKVIEALKQLRSTDDYAKVSGQFKLYRVNGVHQTLVNGLLRSFVPEEQKQQIRMEFLRMGLQYDGNKWALSGIEKKLIITTMPTWVFANRHEKIKVPAEVVLGTALQHKNGFILFENNQQHFAVDASQVRFF